MKKFLIAVSLCLCLLGGFTFAGCDNNNDKIISAQVKQGTIETTIVKDEQLDTQNLVVVFTFGNKTTIEVGASDLELGQIDTSTVGQKALTVKYQDFEFEIQIQVKSLADRYSVSSFESVLLTEWTKNNKEKDDKRFEFINKNTTIIVGDDNPVDFLIDATGIEGMDIITLTNVRTNIEVKIKDGESFKTLGENLSTYATVDTKNTTVDFTDNAIGQEFEVTICPQNLDKDYLSQSEATKTARFKVVDGYNVYDAKHLSVLDNVNTQKWSKIKTELGIENISAKNIIILNNLTITDNDIPADHFWTKSRTGYSELQAKTNLSLNGSLIDATGDFEINSIYKRFVGDNDDFCLYGNGFSIDVQQISKSVIDVSNNPVNVVKEDGDQASYITMHTSLFKFIPQLTKLSNGSYDEDEPVTNGCRPSMGKATFDSIYFLGNGGRTDDPTYSGSMVLCKSNNVNFVAQNTIYKDFFIGYMTECGLSTTEGIPSTTFLMKDTKGYNNYSCHLYCWGAENVKLVNSTLSMCGGPVIIADHVGSNNKNKYNNYDKTTGAGGLPTHINAIGCTLESYVVGNEPWFATYNATEQVATLKTADALFNPLGKSITTTYTSEAGTTPNAINMILVYKNSAAEGMTAGYINRGWMRIFETQEQYDKYYAEENPEKTTYGYDLGDETFGGNNTVASKPYTVTGNPIYFESSASGGYTNSGVQTNGDTSISSGVSYADGKYINVYLPGVGAILEVFNKQA